MFVREVGLIEVMTSSTKPEDAADMCGRWEEENKKGFSVSLLPSRDYV